MSHNSRITAQLGRHSSLKSLQALNLSELQYINHGNLNPPSARKSGFFKKCVESFRTHLPRVRQIAENFLYEPVNEQQMQEDNNLEYEQIEYVNFDCSSTESGR